MTALKEEGFFDFALNFVDPAKAHPVGDFRRKEEIVRTRFPKARRSGRSAQNDNAGGTEWIWRTCKSACCTDAGLKSPALR